MKVPMMCWRIGLLAVGKQEEWQGPGGGQDVAYDIRWRAQTFTPVASHQLTKVVLKLQKVGSPGDITVVIKGTTDGEPSGGNLASYVFDGNAVLTSSMAWYDIPLSCTLYQGQTYAIIIKALNGSSGQQVQIDVDQTGGYTVGERVYSQNSGSTWTKVPGEDWLFEEWGAE